jgi:hypothetical protein
VMMNNRSSNRTLLSLLRQVGLPITCILQVHQTNLLSLHAAPHYTANDLVASANWDNVVAEIMARRQQNRPDGTPDVKVKQRDPLTIDSALKSRDDAAHTNVNRIYEQTHKNIGGIIRSF